jgi:hypothetical protein
MLRADLTGLVLAVSLLAIAGTAAAENPHRATNWRCQVVFRDAVGDAIKSDTPTGSASWPKPYRDGVDGVTCYIVDAPGAGHDRWLYMIIERSRARPSSRFVQFVGQSYPRLDGSIASYSTFANQNTGSFEVKGLAKIEWNPLDPVRRDVMPFRAFLAHPQFLGGVGRLDADSNFTGGVPSDTTSSVFVQPLDACSWQITSYTTEEPFLFESEFGERSTTRTAPRVMRIWETVGKTPVVRGEFPMPFQATVTVIGTKAGCPLP